MVTRMALFGNFVLFIASIFCKKCFVSLINEEDNRALYLRKESRNSDNRHVQELMLETIGRNGGNLLNNLCSLGRPENTLDEQNYRGKRSTVNICV